MATIQHSSLTDSDGLHEPKGVATATTGDVYVADGAGAGSWDPLEGTEIASTTEAGGTKFLQEDGDGTCSWQDVAISTDVSGMAAGVGAFLATPSSANLITAVTDETGTGALVFANSPVLVTPALGTPASGTLTNCTGYPVDGSITPSYGMLSNVLADSSTFAATTSPALLTTFTLATPSSGVTVSAASDDMTIVTAGVYMINFAVTLSTNTPGSANTATFTLYDDPLGVASPAATVILVQRTMSGSGDTGSASFTALYTVSATDKLSIFITSTGNYTYNIISSNFTINRIGGT